MRLPGFALLAALLTVASGCDSTGVDTPTPDPGGLTNPGSGTPGSSTTGPPQTLTFARVDPKATYLRTDAGTPYATAYALSQYGLRPGDTACFKAVNDYTVYPGKLASTTGEPLATGTFSASQTLNATSELNRIKDVIDGNWNVATKPLYTTGAPTDINEDFDATNNCWGVPSGAAYVVFSVYDDSYVDNADADTTQPFGIQVTRR